ncbi:MAG: nucleotidyltransferase domain-containing protein [Thermoplasmatota archaeon]
MKESVVLQQDPVDVVYDGSRFSLLKSLRKEALRIQSRIGEDSFVYGSLARGDVQHGSDIDIVILDETDSFQLEYELGLNEESPVHREIVQATPNHVIKGHIHLNHYTVVTFPLVSFAPVEEEFYRFSGLCSAKDINDGNRVPGVDKRLLLVEPVETGHREYSICDRRVEVSRILGIRMDIIEERIRVLSKRTKYGRTGVFMKEPLKPGETFESKLRYLSDRNYLVRKQLRQRGGSR